MNMIYLKDYRRYLIAVILICLFNVIRAQLPVVENVHFTQRTDGSLLVDIYYDVTTAGGLPLEVTVEASDDNGQSWDLPCSSLTGDVGEDIKEGTNRHIIWDFYKDNPDTSGSDFKVRVIAECMVCGQIITENYTLTRDIFCHDNTKPGICFGDSNIIFDLGGFTIMGDMANDGYIEAIQVDHVNNVTIRNGSIEEFGSGITSGWTKHLVIDNITIKNLNIKDPGIPINGIVFGLCHDLRIQNCHFEFSYAAHRTAINCGNSEFYVDSVEFVGGGVAVGLSGDPNPDLYKTTGSITNSKFYNNFDGILATCNDSFLIADNYFFNSGFTTDPRHEGDVRWLTIDNNEILDGDHSIFFRGGSESVISNNTILNNNFGIFLDVSQGCEPGAGSDCFTTTGMLITGNVVKKNDIDLYHHEDCTGNTWINNDCETCEGSEIPPCTPPIATAGEYLASVDSAASELDEDAGLIRIISEDCDSTGRSYKWYYLYESITRQERYEIWIRSGELIVQDSVTLIWEVPVPDPYPQITGLWMDSDSAVALANDQGGREFIEQTEFKKIGIKLMQIPGGTSYWDIAYLAQDSMLVKQIDAFIIE